MSFLTIVHKIANRKAADTDRISARYAPVLAEVRNSASG